MAKHFLKLLIIFVAMIVLGLIAVSVVAYFDQTTVHPITGRSSQINIAK